VTTSPEGTPDAHSNDSPPDVADLGRRARPDENTPSSGPFDEPGTDGGTAAGNPLEGVGTPEEEPVYPDGADEHL
jgi:hypothetical protein